MLHIFVHQTPAPPVLSGAAACPGVTASGSMSSAALSLLSGSAAVAGMSASGAFTGAALASSLGGLATTSGMRAYGLMGGQVWGANSNPAQFVRRPALVMTVPERPIC